MKKFFKEEDFGDFEGMQSELEGLGISLEYSPEQQMFFVNYLGGDEETLQAFESLGSAYQVGKEMAREKMEAITFTIEDEVEIVQDDYNLILEPGDTILVIPKDAEEQDFEGGEEEEVFHPLEEVNVFFNPSTIKVAIGAFQQAIRNGDDKIVDKAHEEFKIEDPEDIWVMTPYDFKTLWNDLTIAGYIKRR